MKHDPLADTFCVLKNMETIGKKECVTPASRFIEGVLRIMQKKGYIGKFEKFSSGGGEMFRVELLGKINGCGVIKPRFSVKKGEFIKWEKRFLPASNMGILILTTPKGVMDQYSAQKESIGGKLLGYIY